MKRSAYIGFGGNVGDPLATYQKAQAILQESLGTVVGASPMYESKALTLDGAPAQSNYCNAVMVFSTERSPQEILQILLQTERALGRAREGVERWAPRIVDLDLLFVDNLIEKEGPIVLPHPELHKRDFVLRPLCDVAPELVHPELGESVRDLEASLEARGYERFIERSYEG